METIFNSSYCTYEYEATFREKRFNPIELKKDLYFYENSVLVIKNILRMVESHPNPVGLNDAPHISVTNYGGETVWLRDGLPSDIGYEDGGLRDYVREILKAHQPKAHEPTFYLFPTEELTYKVVLNGEEYLLFTFGQMYSQGSHNTAYIIDRAKQRIGEAEARIILIKGWLENPPKTKEHLWEIMEHSVFDTETILPGPEGISLKLQLPSEIIWDVQRISFRTSYGQKASGFFLVLKDTYESGFTMKEDSEEAVMLPDHINQPLYEQWLDNKFTAWKQAVENGGEITVSSCKGMSVTKLPGGSLSTYGTHSDYIKPDGIQLIHYNYGSGRSFGYSHREGEKIKITRNTMKDYYILYGEPTVVDKIFGTRNGPPDDFTD